MKTYNAFNREIYRHNTGSYNSGGITRLFPKLQNLCKFLYYLFKTVSK